MSENNEIAVKVENLHKSFNLAHDKSTSIKSKFVRSFKRHKTDVQKVLDGVSFEIKKGEFFGIVGKNGSGKSTLLKILAGIYAQDQGNVEVNGKLVPFIELGVGFNPELSGRDNVFLNGALLGFSRKEMASMYEEIVDFAELHDHMEKKLKNYSSGMQVRLAFSIAIRAKGDILVLDEVLAVGDEAFQRKCYTYFSELKRENKTVILVTHSMDSIRRFCDRAVLVENGMASKPSKPGIIAKAYASINSANKSDYNSQIAYATGGVNVNWMKVSHNLGYGGVKKLGPREQIEVVVEIKNKGVKDIFDGVYGLTIENEDGLTLFKVLSDEYGTKIETNATKVFKTSIENIFSEGRYIIDIAFVDVGRTKTYSRIDAAIIFEVMGLGQESWLLNPRYKLEIM